MSKKMLSPEERGELLRLTVSVVNAHAHLSSHPEKVSDLLGATFAKLEALILPDDPDFAEGPIGPIPAVPKNESVYPDYLVCLDDGRKLKMLKHHLRALGMTPEQYRDKWGLPPDYPMTAPNYAATRSQLAKASGLGTKKAA